MTYEQKQIQRLYEILDEMEQQHKEDEASTLKWAIFQLERCFSIEIK